MPQLPPVVWLVVAAVALFLLGLCAAVAGAVLRPAARRRIVEWPPSRVALAVVAAAVPWLVVVFAPLRIEAKIQGTGPLIAWTLLALAAFALLVLIPLATLLGVAVWLHARRRTLPSRRPPGVDSQGDPLR